MAEVSEKRDINSYSQDEIIDLWAKKLESGELKQGKHRLCKESKDGGEMNYCCLGVLCEVYMELGGKLRKFEDKGCGTDDYASYAYWNDITETLPNAGVLPEPVKDWIGMASQGGTYIAGKKYNNLTDDNDHKNKNFKEIAEIIRSKPTGMFVSRPTGQV